MAFEQKKLSDTEELANLLYDLYKGLDRAHGSYKLTKNRSESGKVQGRASTVIAPYTAKLWVQHLEGEQGLGVIPINDDNECWWGAIDIDVYPLDLEELEKKIRKLNLPLLVIKTKSGGAHLTCYFSEPIAAKIVRGKLYEFALALGYGGVEIFPKQIMLASDKDVGNWLNMPYFDLKDVTRYAIFNAKPLEVQQFLDIAYKMRLDEETFRNVTVELEGEFEDGPPCLQMICKGGVPEGTRNNTLFAMGVYAKMKFADDDEWQVKLEEMNQKYFQPALKSKEVQLVMKSLSRKEYFYPCNKAPLDRLCNKDLCRKRQFGIGQGADEFSLNIGSLLKITTEPPIWIMDVEGTRVQLDTEDLLLQERFRKACMMNINKLPPRIKTQDWEKLLREKLATVEIVEAPDDSRRSGRINQYAQQFLINTPLAKTLDEVRLGRPYYDKEEDAVLFQGNDLIRYLENQGIKAEPRSIWASLREQGAEHGTVKTKAGMKPVWKIKAEAVPGVNFELPDDKHFDQF